MATAVETMPGNKITDLRFEQSNPINITPNIIEEKLREKIMEMSGKFKSCAHRCRDAKEDLAVAKDREIRAKDLRKVYRLRTREAEEKQKITEDTLKTLEERLRYKLIYVEDSRKLADDMSAVHVEADRVSVNLAAARRKYNDSYQDWQKIRLRQKEMESKVKEKEEAADSLEAREKLLQHRLVIMRDEETRLAREHSLTAGSIEEIKEKDHRLKVQYKQAWERKIAARNKILDLEAKIAQVSEMTDEIVQQRHKAEHELKEEMRLAGIEEE